VNNLLSLNRFFKGIALILILIPPLVSASVMIIELAYDDGEAELFWSDYYPNGVAIEFSPRAREKASKVFGVPTEELEVKMKETQEGPDFYVYHKGKLMAIGDVKSTIYPNEFPDYLWKRAVTDSFNGKYFTKEG